MFIPKDGPSLVRRFLLCKDGAGMAIQKHVKISSLEGDNQLHKKKDNDILILFFIYHIFFILLFYPSPNL
jgi:hypothetical protein